jgi:outer membrane receptor for ferric coprogen and ferric-rhodotorulic acid
VPNKTTQTGAYLAGKFSLAEPLKLITGIRLSNWKYESDDGVGNRKFKNEVTPYAGLVFDFLDQYSWYASYTSIFKPEDKRDINKQYLDPREGKSYETGLKVLKWKAECSLALFNIQQDNLAQEVGQITRPNGTLKHIIELLMVQKVKVLSLKLMVDLPIIGILLLDIVNIKPKKRSGYQYELPRKLIQT